jgi:hypothetical protein
MQPADRPCGAVGDDPDESSEPPVGDALAEAVEALMRLPLTDQEKATATRRLLGRGGSAGTMANGVTTARNRCMRHGDLFANETPTRHARAMNAGKCRLSEVRSRQETGDEHGSEEDQAN